MKQIAKIAGVCVEFSELCNIVFSELKPRLETNQGLAIFAKNRAKFEGWLKVELCEILSKKVAVEPERDRIDLSFNDWGIELKTTNTNVRYPNVVSKTRPITKNIQGIIDDIGKLKKTKLRNKAVCFVAFPITHEDKNWKVHLSKIVSQLTRLEYVEFNFINRVPGVLYLGFI